MSTLWYVSILRKLPLQSGIYHYTYSDWIILGPPMAQALWRNSHDQRYLVPDHFCHRIFFFL